MMSFVHSASTYSTTVFMQGLRKQLQQAELQHNFYVSDALQTVNFDNSPQSLLRLDQFFFAFKKHLGTLAPDFSKTLQKLNTVLFITSHIGFFICSELSYPEHWLSLEELNMFPVTPTTVLTDPQYYFGLDIGGQIVFPIDYVLKHFFTTETTSSISEDIHALIHKLQNQQQIDLQQNTLSDYSYYFKYC
ncbi:hypothetical protein [Acinetobacter thermotolerans]|uniref:hypothetical protein n=2 Tax=Moraxellaceae TaxID=468 RepID=UPI00325ABEB3